MTTVYFVRHAKSDHRNADERTRGLSPRGWEDRARVTRFLADRHVDAAFSSPYQRAVDTISDFTERCGMTVQTVEDFREWQRDARPFASFEDMCRAYWADLDYKSPKSESLREVQHRNIAALASILTACRDQTVIIGTHGMALSTILRYYQPDFGYDAFMRLCPIMPLIVKMTFEGDRFLTAETIDIRSMPI